jgi:hypothetical protein
MLPGSSSQHGQALFLKIDHEAMLFDKPGVSDAAQFGSPARCWSSSSDDRCRALNSATAD